MSSISGRLQIMVLCALLLLSAGCGGSAAKLPGGPRVAVSGKVEFDGQPVPAGAVTFTHKESNVVAICEISDGTYESGDVGASAGENVITVSGLSGPNGDSLWSGGWAREANVTGSSFTFDIAVKKDEVQPAVPKIIDDSNPPE